MRRSPWLLLPLWCLLSTSAARADTIAYVTPVDSLQAAIDAIATSGEIHLAAGFHDACVTIPFGKSIVLYAPEGAGLTTLSCSSLKKPTIDVAGALVLAGLTVTEAGTNRGVVVEATGALVARDVTFDGINATVDGAGLLVNGGVAELDAVTFSALSSTGTGGALRAIAGAQVTVRGSTFTGTTATGNGGAISVDNATVSLWATNLDTASGKRGGAVYGTAFASLLLVDGALTANTATSDGGALLTEGGATVAIVRTAFEGNSATGNGGAVWASGTVDARGATFAANTAVRGGGVFSQSPLAQLTGCTFDANVATGFLSGAKRLAGGGLWVETGTTWSKGNTFANHVGPANGAGGAAFASTSGVLQSVGDLFDANSATFGGALYLDANWGSNVRDSVFTANSADQGGAVYVDINAFEGADLFGMVLDGNTAALEGGGLYAVGSGSVNVYGADVTANTAGTQGGGVFLSGNGNLYVDTSRFEANSAVTGGGIGLDGSLASYDSVLSLYGADLVGNSADTGGGVSARDALVFVTYSRLSDNTATGDGGGLYAAESDYLSVFGASLCANDAERGGGIALADHDGFRSVQASALVENTAVLAGGAAYELGRHLASVSTASSWVQDTIVGNVASNTALDGIAHATGVAFPVDTSIQDTVFVSNDEAAIGVDGAFGATTYLGSAFFGHSLNPPVFNTSNSIGLNGNVVGDPVLAAWTQNGDCSDDDLAALTSVSDGGKNFGWAGYGIGASSYAFSPTLWSDDDGDTYTLAAGDCDDFAGNRAPNAAEIAHDGVDQDCTGADLRDADGDGWAGSDVYGPGGDCDDGNSAVYPGKAESWGDGVDADCDGRDDYDRDGDGSPDASDCAVADPTVHPGAADVWYDGIDADCDGNDGDADGDGLTALVVGGTDCDDRDPAVYPGAPDAWYDGIDADCLGNDDYDQDADGAEFPADCDDTNATVYPGADELPDGLDNDCDTVGDPDADADGIIDYWEAFYGSNADDPDSDGDGIDDGVEWGPDLASPRDTDADGAIDALDDDSDGDSFADADEGAVDSDGDGLEDFRDDDDDGDGVPSAQEPAGDTDGDGLPDRADPDRDGDGAWDGADPNPDDGGADGAGDPPAGPTKYGFGCDTSGGGASPALAGLLAAAALARRARRPVRGGQ